MDTATFTSRTLTKKDFHQGFVDYFVPGVRMSRSDWAGPATFDEALREAAYCATKDSFIAQFTFTNGATGVYMVTGLTGDGMLIDGVGTPNLRCVWSDIHTMTLGAGRPDQTQIAHHIMKDAPPLRACVTLSETDDSGTLYRMMLNTLIDVKLGDGPFRALIESERCTGEVVIEENDEGSLHLFNWRGEHVNLSTGEITHISV